MDKERVLTLAGNIIEETETAILATIDKDGFPQMRAMLNLKCPVQYPKQAGYIRKNFRNFETFFTTNMSSLKVAQIKERSEASVYYTRGFEGLLLTGRVEIVKDEKIKNELWESGWKLYYRKGLTDPDYAVLRFTPRSLKYYSDRKISVLELR